MLYFYNVKKVIIKMYTSLKRLISLISLFSIFIAGLWIIFTFQNQMFAGQQQIVYVQNAKLNLVSNLDKIAKDKHVLIAKRITVPKNDNSGNLENTYVKIGKGTLPAGLPEQKNKTVINNSPDTTAYIIIGKKLTASKLTSILNSLGNTTIVFLNNQSTTLIRMLFLVPEAAFGIIVLLFAFAALIITEYISEIKTAGIKRLAGLSKHAVAFKKVFADIKFITATFVILSVATVIILAINNLLTVQYILLMLIPLFIYALILISISIILSNAIFYILQQQAIGLSIKGRAPIKVIFVIVLIFQVLSIVVTMFSLSGLNSINNQVATIRSGEKQWQANKNYYGLSEIGDISTFDSQKLNNFFDELYSDSRNIFVTNNFDAQNGQAKGTSNINPYYPNKFGTENVITVSPSFIFKSKIKLDAKTSAAILKLNEGQKNASVILIPSSQKNIAKELVKQWETRINLITQATEKVNAHQTSGLYDTDNVFVFPVFYESGQPRSNQMFAHKPIIIVNSQRTYSGANRDLWHILIVDKEKTRQLITKYHLENLIGSFTNGYYALNNRLNNVELQQKAIIIANIISCVSSILLMYLMNVTYLYQYRRKFFIERLAGRSLLEIHYMYIMATIFVSMVIVLVSILLRIPLVIALLPIVYLGMLLLLFFIQIKTSMKDNVLYMKGE